MLANIRVLYFRHTLPGRPGVELANGIWHLVNGILPIGATASIFESKITHSTNTKTRTMAGLVI